MKKKLPVSAVKAFGETHGFSRVLIIAVDDQNDTTHTASWGNTKKLCGHAAMDIQKLHAVLKAQPTSLKDAIATAELVKPTDIEGY